MGNFASCPVGFEQGLFLSCHAQCPAEFKYVNESGNPPVEKCVHVTRNNRFVTLTPLPIPIKDQPIPPSYPRETKRLATEIAKVRAQVLEDDQTQRAINDARDEKRGMTQGYSKINSDYATFTESAKVAKAMKETIDTLKPMRLPTSPSSDIEEERKAILAYSDKRLLFIQIALVLAVLSLVSYLVLPSEYAHGVVFILLCVGISSGFFLRR